MNKIIYSVVLGLALFLLQGSTFATDDYDEAMEQATQKSSESATPATQILPIEMNNYICPVSGEKIGEMGEVVKFEYEGKVYNLCCSMCVKDFKKEPQKYMLIVDEELSTRKTSSEPVASTPQP